MMTDTTDLLLSEYERDAETSETPTLEDEVSRLIGKTPNWTAIEAKCRCPHIVGYYNVYVDRDLVDDVDEVPDELRDGLEQHAHFEDGDGQSCPVEDVKLEIHASKESHVEVDV